MDQFTRRVKRVQIECGQIFCQEMGKLISKSLLFLRSSEQKINIFFMWRTSFSPLTDMWSIKIMKTCLASLFTRNLVMTKDLHQTFLEHKDFQHATKYSNMSSAVTKPLYFCPYTGQL